MGVRPLASARVLFTAVLVVALVGCEEEKIIRAGGSGDPNGRGEGESGPGAPSASGGRDAGVASFDEGDFVEVNVDNRDPFRGFTESFNVEAPDTVQRRVIMPETTVEQMKLIAVISGVPQPRAMLVDPTGVGHIVKRGDYVGRAEVVQAGGAEGIPVSLNWRVDRVRSNEVVLTREDPTAPDQPPLNRVLTLYEEDELARARMER